MRTSASPSIRSGSDCELVPGVDQVDRHRQAGSRESRLASGAFRLHGIDSGRPDRWNRSKVPPFPKPRFDFSYDLAHEVAALRDYRQATSRAGRFRRRNGPPARSRTWNVRQPRRPGPARQRLCADRRGDQLVRPRRGAGGERRPARDRGDPLAPARRATTCSSRTRPATASVRRSSTTAARSPACVRSAASRFRRASCRGSQSPGADHRLLRLRPRSLPGELPSRAPSASRC